MTSVCEDKNMISAFLNEECLLGRVVGPLDPRAFPSVHCSPIGLVPKRSTGKWRLIVDLSSPHGRSVNDGIDPALCSLEYVTVDLVADVVASFPGSLLSKIDIRSAYRTVPVHPEDRRLLGMLWEGQLFVDTVLPFGLQSAPKLFTAVADAVEWIAKLRGIQLLFHYLDDFLLVSSSASGAAQLDSLLEVFADLGLPLALEKLEASPRVTFLGIEMDSIYMELRLPQKKISELKGLIRDWLGRRSCRKRELQSLVGKLQHACKVVKPGRSFLRRMFELLAGMHKDHHHIRLNTSFRSDLVWWDTFLEAWNGKSFLRRPFDDAVGDVSLFSDASGSFGCGAWWAHHWFQFEWPGSWGGRNIMLKEILPVVLACAVWGPQWRGRKVVVHVDNEGAVAVLNSGCSKEGQIMHLMRSLFFIVAHYQVSLRACHVPGAQNGIADAISRNNLSLFFSLHQGAVLTATRLPELLVALLVTEQPDWTSTAWSQLFRSCFQLVWQPLP